MKGSPVSPSSLPAANNNGASNTYAQTSASSMQPMDETSSVNAASARSALNTTTHYHQMNYLTITQDPYPPLNNSPDFFEYSNGMTSGGNSEQMPSIIDCIDMEDFDLSTFERGANGQLICNVDNIKKE
jgi:hypothetical protein